ncbi:hypothetical protein OUZ56_001979 [Daphnia magna]|uniref:Uncharacterized protein n=1 Tax=Daphnia magna TaxID=35525 RepID=A0ABR0A4B2_9CRUS|nr:hypothetical protein OUZ56_001979 [Daphnia magna]
MTKVYTYVLVGRFQELKDVTTSVGDAPSFIHPDRARPHPVAVVKFRRGDVQLAMTFRVA